jgi:hypothetical protein
VPSRWCACTGCAACAPQGRTHGVLYDADTTRTLRCPPCQAIATAKRNTRPNSAQRGYDGEYQRNKPIVIQQGRNGRPCWICGRSFTAADKITAEHIKPLREGGSSQLENLAPAHSWCNTGWNRGR